MYKIIEHKIFYTDKDEFNVTLNSYESVENCYDEIQKDSREPYTLQQDEIGRPLYFILDEKYIQDLEKLKPEQLENFLEQFSEEIDYATAYGECL